MSYQSPSLWIGLAKNFYKNFEKDSSLTQKPDRIDIAWLQLRDIAYKYSSDDFYTDSEIYKNEFPDIVEDYIPKEHAFHHQKKQPAHMLVIPWQFISVYLIACKKANYTLSIHYQWSRSKKHMPTSGSLIITLELRTEPGIITIIYSKPCVPDHIDRKSVV